MKATGPMSWNLNTSDLEAASKFYRDVLGAEVRVAHQVRGVDVLRLTLGNASLGLFDASSGPQEGVPHHTFEIQGPEDPEELKRELEALGQQVKGVRVHGEDSGYSVYLDDPDGNRIELSKGEG